MASAEVRSEVWQNVGAENKYLINEKYSEIYDRSWKIWENCGM